MGWKKILAIVLQIPAWLIIIIAFFTSVYAWLNKIQDIGIWTPMILLFAILLYIIGRWMVKEKDDEDNGGKKYHENLS